MLSYLLVTLGQTNQSYERQFDLYPHVSTSPAITQADADSGKQKSLAKVYKGPETGQASLDNGVVRLTCDLSGKVLLFENRKSGITLTESIGTPLLTINDQIFDLSQPGERFRQIGAQGVMSSKPFDWRPLLGQTGIWPPRGMGLKFTYAHNEFPGLFFERTFEMLDREPTIRQKIVIRNGSTIAIALNKVDSQGYWPDEWLKGKRVDLLVRPGGVLELPDQWLTITGGGGEVGNGFREKSRHILQPWRGLKVQKVDDPAITAEQAAAIKKQGTQVALMPESVSINWSSPGQADYDKVASFISTVKTAKLIPGAVINLKSIPGEEKDRTGSESNPVCWLSFAGNHWRQNVILTWKRMGIEYIKLEGDLPRECIRPGHDHQGTLPSEFENREAIRQLAAQGLTLGVLIEHPDLQAYGPARWL